MAGEQKFDLCVIGRGPGAIAAAQRARTAGASVALVEAGEPRETLQGGALPARALAQTALRAHRIANAADLGLGANEVRINFARINARLHTVAEAAAPDRSPERLTASGIVLIKGPAKFIDPSQIEADGQKIKARRFLIATQTRPFIPEIPGIDDVEVHTPDTIMEITRRPTHLMVVGAGATGLSLAQSHARLGAQVTLIDTHEVLAGSDRELTEAVLRRLEAEGVAIRPHTGIVGIAREGEEIVLDLKTGAHEDRITGSHVLFCTGRRADFTALALDAAKVEYDAGEPRLRPDGRTSNRRIFLAGEAAGHKGTHAVRHSAETAVETLLGLGRLRRAPVPVIVHTDPAIAEVGLTEAQARERFGTRFSVTRASFAHTDAARAAAEPHGHVKLIAKDNGVILGAGLVGPFAPELVPVFALAIGKAMTVQELDRLVFPYPAFGEVISLLAREYVLADPKRAAPNWRSRLNRLLP